MKKYFILFLFIIINNFFFFYLGKQEGRNEGKDQEYKRITNLFKYHFWELKEIPK